MDKGKLFAALDAKIIETIDLGEFHERFEGQTLQVWLNPDETEMKKLREIQDVIERGKERMALQLVDLTPDETRTLFSKDAPFCEWLLDRVMELNRVYREGRKKKSTTP